MKILLALLSISAFAQTHIATLVWTDPANPAGATYSVYRAPGLCSGSPVFAKIGTGITAKTYKDDTVQPGNYCYQVTASINGVESAPSPTAMAPIPAFAPQNLQVTVQ